jgi:hypothetical protein
MSIYWLVLGTLGTWRVTHLLAREDGPWNAIARLRRAATARWWSDLLDCFYCLSLWVAAPVALLIGAEWSERVLLWLALSGGAILIERAIPDPGPPAAAYSEDPESDDVLLQQGAPTRDDRGGLDRRQA